MGRIKNMVKYKYYYIIFIKDIVVIVFTGAFITISNPTSGRGDSIQGFCSAIVLLFNRDFK